MPSTEARDRMQRLSFMVPLAMGDEPVDIPGASKRVTPIATARDAIREAAAEAVAAEDERITREVEGLPHQQHLSVEDCWYSCPLSEDGCCDDRQTGCTCGAERWIDRTAVLAIVNGNEPGL